MAEENTVVLGYRVTRERRKELKKWAAEHDTSVQAMVEQALELLLNSGRVSAAIDPQKAVDKMAKSLQIRNRLIHTGLDPRWGDWTLSILNCKLEWIVSGLGGNILTFLHSLERKQQRGEVHAPGDDTPDYAKAVDECTNALEQLGRSFAARRKKRSGLAKKPDPQRNED